MARGAVKRQRRRAIVPNSDLERSQRGPKTARVSIPIVSLQAEEDRTQHTTVLPDLRPPAEPERQRPSSDERNFSGGKVARILANYGVDMDEFVNFYDKLPRKLDLWKAPDEYEMEAVETFLQHQDLNELCKDLDLPQYGALKLCVRYLIWSFNQEEDEEEEGQNGAELNGSGHDHLEEIVVSG